MNKIIYIFFVLLSQNATCQVLKFNDLIRMTFDLNTFEKINLSMGNQMVNQQKKTFYSYQTKLVKSALQLNYQLTIKNMKLYFYLRMVTNIGNLKLTHLI